MQMAKKKIEPIESCRSQAQRQQTISPGKAMKMQHIRYK